MTRSLDDVSFDWTRFDEAGRRSRALLQALSDDRATLRALVLAVERDEALLAQCERHELLDYIVLCDAVERGFRLRVHLSTDAHHERPHDHRFSFSSRILCGHYEHTIYRVDRPLYEDPHERAKPWIDKAHPDPESELTFSDMAPLCTRIEAAGDTYTLHHATVHTTYTTPGTVSLFLRGPAEKARSLIFDRETGRVWWRFGQANEPAWRRTDKRMSREHYRAFVARLEALGVI